MNDINTKITETIVPATITENIINARIDNYSNPGVQGPKGEKGEKGEPGIGVTAEDVGFTITAGTTPKTLTVALDASVSGTNTGDQTIPDHLSDLSDDSTHRLVTDVEKSTWNAKQEALVSGTNIKTINSNSILGSGNLVLSSSDEKVKYDVNDTTAGYIADKIIAGIGISVGEGSGANENKLVITNNNSTPYTLPTASTTVLGGVKVDGTTISITEGVISGSSTYSLPTASTTVLGGVKIDGTSITITDGVISGANTLDKAAGTDINTGTDDAKYVTSKAIEDSYLDDAIVSLDKSVTNVIALTKAEYDALSSGEKVGNTYITTDENDGNTDLALNNLTISNSLTVGGKSLLDYFYPVGTIYETTSTNLDTTTKMGNHFGGTWEVYGAGRTSVGYNASEAEFNTIGKTGGAKTHTLTIAQMPSHNHPYTISGSTPGGSGHAQWTTTGSQPWTTGSSGGDQPHNNLQPYIVVYRYRRTA